VIFLDTSVLVPIAQVSHTHHRASADLWNFLTQKETFVSTHTLAETYSTLTAMSPRFRLSPMDVLLVIETFLKRLTPVTLSADEYLETVRTTAALGHSSGMIYDALHLACARKVNADRIYTWNVKNFRLLAPDLADRITNP